MKLLPFELYESMYELLTSQFKVQHSMTHTPSFWPALSRVARWHIFKPKIPIWVNFGGSCNVRYISILLVHSVYFTDIWYILWPFGIFYGCLVYFSRFGMFFVANTFQIQPFHKGLATQAETRFGMLYQEKSGSPGSVTSH
jgi:hypothetical protein